MVTKYLVIKDVIHTIEDFNNTINQLTLNRRCFSAEQ